MEDDEAFLRALAQTEERLAAPGPEKRARHQGSFTDALPPRPSSAPARSTGAAAVHRGTVTLTVWDRFRFSVAKDYPPGLHGLLGQVPMAVWDAGLQCFHFPLRQYAHLVALLKAQQYVDIREPPATVLDLFLGPPRQLAALEPGRIPDTMWQQMFEFQRTGVEFVIARNGKAYIGDEMGLGKTVQAIAVASYYRADWPLLVICPSSLKASWGQQVEKWLPSEAPGINIVLQKKRARLDAPINIVSFNLAASMGPELTQKAFQMIIVDESHALKSNKTKRTQVIAPLLQRARRVVLLSGTPALSRPVELFSQLSCLAPLMFPNFMAFALRYCNARRMPWGAWDFSGSSNSRELNVVLSTLMVRRKKDDVLHQLPAKLRQKVLLDVDSKSLAALQKQMETMSFATDTLFGAQERETASLASSVKNQVWFQLFRDVGRAKLPSIIEYVLEHLGDEDVGEKFLVFAHHKDVVAGICAALSSNKKPYICIDGTTPPGRRQPLVDTFQSDPKCRVAVLSILAAGTGLTMTAASFVLFAELYYNPGAMLQAEDRAHRIGQRSTVVVHYLVAKGTIDEQIFRLLNRKIAVLGETLDGVVGERLELAPGSQGEIHRKRAEEQLLNASQDDFVKDLLAMVQRGAASQDHVADAVFPAPVHEENMDADAALKAFLLAKSAAQAAPAEPVAALPAAPVNADEVLLRVRQRDTSANKFATFGFGGK